jgi:hypothetical protein
MNKKLIFLLLFGLINANLFLFAQRDEKRRAEFEEFRQKRIAFISETMKLTSNEAKAFWPLEDELQIKKFELNRQLRRALSEFRGNERERKKRTEPEYRDFVNLYASFKIREARLDEEYIAKFAKVISYEKIYLYQQAEQQFARQMLNQSREGAPPPPREGNGQRPR